MMRRSALCITHSDKPNHRNFRVWNRHSGMTLRSSTTMC